MSHFSVLAVVNVDGTSASGEHREDLFNRTDEKLADMMAPYDENTCDPNCLEFVNCMEEICKDYETGTEDCIKTPDGRILALFDRELYGRFVISEEVVVQCSSGQLHHPRRSKKAKKYQALLHYPLKKRFPSLEAYAVDCGFSYNAASGGYGYYQNSAAKWDWYEVGGRWEYRFLVKEDCPSDIDRRYTGLQKECEAPPAPAGYRWTCGARKKDIQWEMMKELAVAEGKARYVCYKTWFEQGEITGCDYPLYHITEEGVRDWDELVYVKGETLDEYLTRTGLSAMDSYRCSFYSVLTEDGWASRGEMGWFGISDDNMEEREWHDQLQMFLKNAPDEAMLLSVDCHT